MSSATTSQTLVESIIEQATQLWYSKQYDEARNLLQFTLRQRDITDAERIALTNILALVERDDRNLVEAIRVIHEVYPLVETCKIPLLVGKCHNTLASIYLRLEDFDKAIFEFTAASVNYEKAKDVRRRSDTENNLACVLVRVGYFKDAHIHLDMALEGCTDADLIAQIHDSRARVFLGEAKPYEALSFATRSVLHLRTTDKFKLLDESLATLALVLDFIREAEPVKRALIEAGGDLEETAKLLGMKSRQNVEYYIRKYPHLRAYRAPAKKPRGSYAKPR